MTALSTLPDHFLSPPHEFRRMDKLTGFLTYNFLRVAEGFRTFNGLSEDTSCEKFQNFVQVSAQENRRIFYAVYSTSQLPVGVIIFGHPRMKPNDVNMAYYVVPNERGKGVAVDLCNQALKVFFKETDYPRVLCAIFESNTASKRVLERLGVAYLGYLPSYIDELPAYDHQFEMRRDHFMDPARRPVKIMFQPAAK